MRAVSVLILILLVSVATVFVMAKPATLDCVTLLAAPPPMGWNSWDAYGETVSEADIRASAALDRQSCGPHDGKDRRVARASGIR